MTHAEDDILGCFNWVVKSSADEPLPSIHIFQSADVPGEWVAHWLDRDIVSQGRTPRHALSMLFDAIMFAFASDTEDGVSPTERPAAPPECWARYHFAQASGGRNRPAGAGGGLAISER